MHTNVDLIGVSKKRISIEEIETEITPPMPILAPDLPDSAINRFEFGQPARFSSKNFAEANKVATRKIEARRQILADYEQNNGGLSDCLEPEDATKITSWKFYLLLLIIGATALTLGIGAGSAHLWWPALQALARRPAIMLASSMSIAVGIFVGVAAMIYYWPRERR